MPFFCASSGVALHPPCLIVGGDTNPAREGCVCVCGGGELGLGSQIWISGRVASRRAFGIKSVTKQTCGSVRCDEKIREQLFETFWRCNIWLCQERNEETSNQITMQIYNCAVVCYIFEYNLWKIDLDQYSHSALCVCSTLASILVSTAAASPRHDLAACV